MPEQDEIPLAQEELASLREEEAMTLEATYGPRFQQDLTENDRVHFQIQLTARLLPTSRTRVPLVLDVILPIHEAILMCLLSLS